MKAATRLISASGAKDSSNTYFYTSTNSASAPLKALESETAISGTFTDIDTLTGSTILGGYTPSWVPEFNQIIYPSRVNSNWRFNVSNIDDDGSFGTSYDYAYEDNNQGSDQFGRLAVTSSGEHFYAKTDSGNIRRFANSGTAITYSGTTNLGSFNSVDYFDVSIDNDWLAWNSGTRINVGIVSTEGGDTTSTSSAIVGSNDCGPIKFHPIDNNVLATGQEGGSNTEVQIWEAVSGPSANELASVTLVGGASGIKVNDVSWSPDGTHLAVAVDGVRYSDVNYYFFVLSWNGTNLTVTDYLGFDRENTKQCVWLDNNFIAVTLSRNNNSLVIVDATNKSNISVEAQRSDSLRYTGICTSETI